MTIPDPFQELLALVPPPGPRRQVDWAAAEADLGFALPSDYKALVEAYGHGVFDDFLWVLQPLARNKNLDLGAQSREALEWLRQVRDSPGAAFVPYDIDDPAGHLVAWAITDNGDTIFWRRAPGAPPDTWQVTLNEGRGPRWDEFDGSATQLLVTILGRRMQSAVFPDDFPSDAPTFQPVEDE